MERRRQVYRNLKSLGEAKEIFQARFRNAAAGVESVPVRESLGRILARPVQALRSVPGYHSAAMDGIAVRAASTFGALPERPVTLQAGGEAVQVNTGDPMPGWADAIVMIEHVEARGTVFEVREAAYPWQNVRKAGEDVVKSEFLLPARHRIRAYDQGPLLASGNLSVHVFRKPRVLIVPTGDEIVAPEEAAGGTLPGSIIEVNGQVLSSMAVECGAEAHLAGPVPDDPARIREAVAAGLDAGFDAVLIVAGSSAGTEDFTSAVLGEMGQLLVHGVTVMPGKPTLLAAVRDRPVVGVPGYPVSAVVAFREFVRPLLYRMQGLPAPEPAAVDATLARKLPSRPGLEEHVRVILGEVGGRLVAVPIAGGAGLMTSLTRADGILRVPPEVTGYSEGDRVRIELLSDAAAADGRLLAIGSHDPAIDLLGSVIRERSGGTMSLSSSNVGSLGGLLAVGKGIAHFAGCHLLDTQTGDYNLSYVRRYLPHPKVTLVTLAHRRQGLMVAKGNPKRIGGVPDLGRREIVFVNRQAGSGTRILLDYELQRAGIDAASITGYRNEEYTHMSVAMAVAAGSADAGLGVMAAARALDLDFIPVARERFDLVILTSLMEHPGIRILLEIIRSPEFQEQVLATGGYDVEETGTAIQP